jgi:hypothetical protein
MTMNESQGQSVDHVGVDLRNPVFTLGQLYVAHLLSPVLLNSPIHIKILLPEGSESEKTRNVVYKHILID